ncbi:hypothetical protein WA158_005444 [Blastocystis sp. Blastoise]
MFIIGSILQETDYLFLFISTVENLQIFTKAMNLLYNTIYKVYTDDREDEMKNFIVQRQTCNTFSVCIQNNNIYIYRRGLSICTFFESEALLTHVFKLLMLYSDNDAFCFKYSLKLFLYTSLSSDSPYLSSSRLQALIPTLAPLLASPLHTHRLHALLTSYKSLTDALLHSSKNVKAGYNSYTINFDLLIVIIHGNIVINTGLLTVKLAGSLPLIQFINIKPLFNNIYAQSTLQNMPDIHNTNSYIHIQILTMDMILSLIEQSKVRWTLSEDLYASFLCIRIPKITLNSLTILLRIVSDGITLYSLLLLGLNSTYIHTLINLYLQLPFDLMISRGVKNVHSRNLFVDRINGEATMNAIINYLSFKARPTSDKTVLRILKQNIEVDRRISFLLLTLDIRQYFTSSFSLFSFIMINNNEPLLTSLAATIDAGTKYKNVYLLQEQLNKDNIHDLYDSPEFLRYQYVDIPLSSLLLLPAESLNELLSVAITTFLSLNSPRDISLCLTIFFDDPSIYLSISCRRHCLWYIYSPVVPLRYSLSLHPRPISKDFYTHNMLLSSNILRIDIQSVIRSVHHHFQYKTDGHELIYTMTIKAKNEFMEKLKKSQDDETAQLIYLVPDIEDNSSYHFVGPVDLFNVITNLENVPRKRFKCYPMCLVYHIFGLYYLKWNRFWQKLTQCCVRIASLDNKLYWNYFYAKAYLINGYIDINIYDHIGYSILSKEEKKYCIVYGLERLQDRYKHYIKYSTLTFVLKQRLSMGEELLYGLLN